MMKHSKLVTLIVVLVFLSPMQLYSSWHLKQFSEGIIYTLLSLTYIPYDYKRPIWEGMLSEGKIITTDIAYKYKGKYEVYLFGSPVKNKKIIFNIYLQCDNFNPPPFISKNVQATDLNREWNNKILLASISLPSNKNSLKNCTIKYTSNEPYGKIFLKIVKMTQW